MAYILIENYDSLIVNCSESIKFNANIKLIVPFSNIYIILLETNKIYYCEINKHVAKEIPINNFENNEIDDLTMTKGYMKLYMILLCNGNIFCGELKNEVNGYNIWNVEHISTKYHIQKLGTFYYPNNLLLLTNNGNVLILHYDTWKITEIKIPIGKIKLICDNYTTNTIFLVDENNKLIRGNLDGNNIKKLHGINTDAIQCDIIQICALSLGTKIPEIFILGSDGCVYRLFGKKCEQIEIIKDIGNIIQIGFNKHCGIVENGLWGIIEKLHLKNKNGDIFAIKREKKLDPINPLKIFEDKYITGILSSYQNIYYKNANV